jgi:hypothetical protein
MACWPSLWQAECIHVAEQEPAVVFITLSNSVYGTVFDIPGMLESVAPFLGAEVLASTEQCVVHRERRYGDKTSKHE